MADNQKDKWLAQGERLKIFYEENGLNQNSLSKLLGVNQSNISNILTGRRGIPWKWIELLKVKYPSLNIMWLSTGKGSMLEATEVKEPDPVYLTKANAKELTMEEVAVILSRLQHEVSELKAWQVGADLLITALGVKAAYDAEENGKV